jgi:hypothetical protein
VLSVWPWSLVELFPRTQGPGVPSCLAPQPPRSQEIPEPCGIETDFPMSQVCSIYRLLDSLLHRHRGGNKARNHQVQSRSPTRCIGPRKPWNQVSSGRKAYWDTGLSRPGPLETMAARMPRNLDCSRANVSRSLAAMVHCSHSDQARPGTSGSMAPWRHGCQASWEAQVPRSLNIQRTRSPRCRGCNSIELPWTTWYLQLIDHLGSLA